MDFSKIKFHGDAIGDGGKAIINPGYPFIGMPMSSFDHFKQDVIEAYPEEQLTCEDVDWCYFIQSCSKISEKMPDLEFTFKTTGDKDAIVTVPVEAFLYTLKDYQTGFDQCHIGIIG